MREKDENGVCPHCGEIAVEQPAPLLAPGTVIGERYHIGKAFKHNGEGYTYVAYDTKLSRSCTVREFFPEELAARDEDGVTVLVRQGSEASFERCQNAFIKLWTKLMRLKGLTSLISVYDVQTINSTAYSVWAESEETTLRTYLLSTDTGYISWDKARILFMPVISTLSTLHTSGIIHKRLDPSAFIFTKEGRLKITDFCTSEVTTAYGELSSDISDEYAPLEVYTESMPTGTWTDVYAFTAVLYRTLIGSTPIASRIRARNDQMMIPAKFAEQLPPYVINALINGMQLEIEDRTANAEQLRSNLSASPRAVSASAAPAAAPVHAPVQTSAPKTAPPVYRAPEQPRSVYIDPVPTAPEKLENTAEERAKKAAADKRKKVLIILLCILLCLVLLGIGLVVSDIKGSSNPPAETTAVVSSEITVPNFAGQMYTSVVSDTYFLSVFQFKQTTMSSASIPAGQIVSQDIPANTKVSKGTCILLTVSTGPDSFQLPDVTNLTYEEAIAVLSAKGLVCVKSTKYNDGTHEKDTVAETLPEKGTTVTAGDTVYISLWDNPEDEETSANENTLNEATTVSNGVPQIFGAN